MSKLKRILEAQDGDSDDYFYKGGMEGGEKTPEQEKYGDDMDNFNTGLTDGIQKERCCTDIFCLALYWVFIAGMIYASMYGYQNGQYHKLTAPLDANNNFCGFDKMAGYPKMIFTKFGVTEANDILKSGVCVTLCPNEKKDKGTWKTGETCLDNEAIKCADAGYYDTIDVFDFCVPTSADALSPDEKAGYNALMQGFKNTAAGSVVMDLFKMRTGIYICFGTALVWSIVYIYIMSIFAETLAWCCVILIQLGLFGAAIGGYFVYDEQNKIYGQLKAENNYDGMTEDQKKDFDAANSPILYLVMTGFFGLLALIFLCMIMLGRKSLQSAIDVIDASADYIAHNKRVILVPNLHFLITIIIVIAWSGAFLCCMSLGQISPDPLIPQKKTVSFSKENKKYFYLCMAMVFGVLWLTAWVEYTSRFVIIVGAATYYFNNHRDRADEEASADICYGFKCAYLHHMGSIAFGAFIIALIRFIKLVFYYFAKKAQKMSGDNPAVKCAVGCAICILNCIERICDYLNEAAFCYMAVTGEHFLLAAWHGFLLNLKHGLKFVFANLIAKVFIFIGKVGIVVANCFTLVFVVKNLKGKAVNDTEEVNSIWGPVVVVAIVTYIAASLFLSLFEEAVMALLTCLCVDMDMNGGEAKFGPATFHDDYLGKMDSKDEKTNEVE